MLTIRNAQMEVLRSYLLEGLLRRMAAFVRANFATATGEVPDDMLFRRVERDYGRAVQFGFVTEQEIFEYLRLTFTLGEHFIEESSYAHLAEVLHEPQMDADTKVEIMQSLVRYLPK